MIQQPPRSTHTDTLFPYTTLFRSNDVLEGRFAVEPSRLPLQQPPQPMPWRHGFRTRAVLRVLPVVSVATAPRTRRKITVDRLVPQLRHQRHAAAIGDQLRHRRLRIAAVAAVPGAGRAGLHAGRLALALVTSEEHP